MYIVYDYLAKLDNNLVLTFSIVASWLEFLLPAARKTSSLVQTMVVHVEHMNNKNVYA